MKKLLLLFFAVSLFSGAKATSPFLDSLLLSEDSPIAIGNSAYNLKNIKPKDSFLAPFFHTYNFVDSLSCIEQNKLSISIGYPPLIFVPNSYTANGHGRYEYVFVMGDEKRVDKIISFRIFDRWGQLIFSKEDIAINDPNEGWDGTFNGKHLQANVYVWYAEAQLWDGSKTTEKGQITILR